MGKSEWLTVGEVEDVELGEVGAEVEGGGVVVAAEHVLIGETGAEEDPQPGQQQLRSGELVVPAEHVEVANGEEGLGVLGDARVCGQREVAGVAGGVVHPRRAPHVLIVVAGGVVERRRLGSTQ